MRSSFATAVAAPTLLLASATAASAVPYHNHIGAHNHDPLVFGDHYILDDRDFYQDYGPRNFYTIERTETSFYSAYLYTDTGRKTVEVKGLSPEPRGQGRNFAPDDSTIGVWQVNDNGVRSCMAAGMIATEKTYQPEKEYVEAIQSGMTHAEAAAAIPEMEASQNAPIVEYHNYGDGSEMKIWAGFGIDPMDEELAEGAAVIEVNGQSFEGEIVRDPENNYKLLIGDEEARDALAETILGSEDVVTVRINSDHSTEPKVVSLNMQGTVDVREAMDTCMSQENEVSASRIPFIKLNPVEVDFSEPQLNAMLGAQCLNDYDADDIEQVLQVDGAEGMLVRASHAFRMADGKTLIGDYYENGPNGEYVSQSWQDDAETSCAGGNRIEITHTADQVAQAVTGQTTTNTYSSWNGGGYGLGGFFGGGGSGGNPGNNNPGTDPGGDSGGDPDGDNTTDPNVIPVPIIGFVGLGAATGGLWLLGRGQKSSAEVASENSAPTTTTGSPPTFQA